MAKVYLTKLKIILHSNLWICFFFLLTCLLTFIRIQIGFKSVYKEGEYQLTGVVKRIKRTSSYTMLEVRAKENLEVIIYQNIKVKLGDVITVNGKLERPDENRMEHLFNYRSYLLSKKIYWLMTATSIKRRHHSTTFLDSFKNFLYQTIESRQQKKYYKVFLLGDQSDLSDEEKRTIRKLGISHLFSISGTHLSVFTFFLLKVLSYFHLSLKKKNIILLSILFSYVTLTVQSVSIMRAFFFLLLLTVNKIYHLKFSSLQLFFYLCMGFLFVNPFIIYDIGFLYSFIISFFLLSFKNYISKGSSLLKVSVISFFASVPITLASSFELNLWSVFINLIFTPWISMVIFPCSFLGFLFPFFDSYFNVYILILEKMIFFFNNNVCWMVVFGYIHFFLYFFYYLILYLNLKALLYKNYFYFLFFFGLFLFHLSFPYLKSNTTVTFLDVDQGDSALISLAHNAGNILIDTGGSIDGKRCYNEILPFLKSRGITHLDYLLLTHGDFDHMGEAIHLVNNFKVDKVIFNHDDYNEAETELIKVLDKKKIKYYKGLRELNIGKYKLQFLNTKTYDNENDNSNVIYFNYYKYKFLFMGDAGKEREKDILDKYNIKNIDFLKVGHHGSDTSSSKYFIDCINPKYSIISVGKNNRYGHPKDTVLETLKDSKIYRTDQDGSIKFKIKKNKLEIETCTP